MDFICPSCSSDNIQRLSVVYESGLSDINTRSRGAGLGIGRGDIGAGVGAIKTKGISQTAASQRAAPPPKKGYLKPLLGIFAVFLILSFIVRDAGSIVGTVVGWAYLAASAWSAYLTYQYNSTTWLSLKAAWDDTFLCNRCNDMFNLSDN